MDNTRIAIELIRVAKLIGTGSRTAKTLRSPRNYQKGKVVGKGMRMRWGNFSILLEELPQKGKKKLRVFDLHMWQGADDPYFNMANLLREAKVKGSDSYDQAKKALEKAAETMLEAAIGRGYDAKPHWFSMGEESVSYLEIDPEDAEPMDVKGKDFELHSEWTKFSMCEYHGDPHDMDPSYTDIVSSSPASGRKLYKMLKADPKLLSGIGSGAFTDWLKKNGIKYEMHFSQWR